jgi:hypothetical protein
MNTTEDLTLSELRDFYRLAEADHTVALLTEDRDLWLSTAERARRLSIAYTAALMDSIASLKEELGR